jgi:hypothetical protein
MTYFIMRNGRVTLPLDEREVPALQKRQVVATAIRDVGRSALTGATIHLRYIIRPSG